MWLSLVFKAIIAFINNISEKNFKTTLVFLTSIFLVSTFVINNKITQLSHDIQNLPALINHQDSMLEKRVNSKMDYMFSDATIIFTDYTKSNQNDLNTIIDNLNQVNSNTSLLKALINKTSQETLQEIRKRHFNRKYSPDSLNITIEPVSFINYYNNLYAFTP